MARMSRLSRKESHALTRARLVETATALFLADGYNATSLEKVAAEAGFSKGAVYSNFATKHELGLAVLDRVRVQRATALLEAVKDQQGLEDRLAAFGRWAEENIGDVSWTTLEVEFATSNRHVAGIGDHLAGRRREITRLVADLLTQQAAELGVDLPVPADELAVQLLSLGIGLGVQRAFDPELPVTSLVDALRLVTARSAPR